MKKWNLWVLLLWASIFHAQNFGTLPKTLTLSRTQLDRFISAKPGTVVSDSASEPFGRCTVLKHIQTGDLQYIQIQLSGFYNYYLIIQINGNYSQLYSIQTQSEPKSGQGSNPCYKGELIQNQLIFTLTETDAVYSE